MKKSIKLTEKIQKNIIEFLNKELYNRHMSQRELGERIGTSKQYVQKILSGKKGFTFKTLIKISKALDLDISIIMDDKTNEN